jgi:uncharacterized membrane protein YgcG
MNEFKLFGNALAIGAIMLGSASADIALAADSGEAVPGAAFGSQTDAWLSMQLNPAYTANDPRPIPGEVANKTYIRYLNSFSHPIPEQFERQSFSSSGGGGSSSSGSGASSSSGSGGSSP